MTTPKRVYEFKEVFRASESPRIVCIGSERTISAIISPDELADFFGGWIIYTAEERGEAIWAYGEPERSKRSDECCVNAAQS
jgi:hypothetical protein